MIKKIINFSIHHKLIIIVLTIALIVQGIISFRNLKIDALPDITNVQVQIIAIVPSLGAADVERLITIPIEQASANIAHIQEVRSISRFGLAIVTVVFNDDVDIFWARQQVAERLNVVQSQIPPGLCTPVLGPITTGLGEIYQYVVRTKFGYESKYTLTDLRTIQDWIIRKKLIEVKGVADVSALGGDLKQYEISINNDKLKSLNINIDEIINAVEKNNQNTGGAYIERGPTAQFIRTQGLYDNIDDIKNTVVTFKGRELPVFIKDIAEVKIGSAVKYGATTYNDEGEVVGAIVMMTQGENSAVVVKNIKEKIAEIQKALPEGVVIEPFLDRTKMINSTFSTIKNNLIEGCLIIIFILLIILSNLRASLIVASIIPLSFLFAIILMDFFGISANLMSLGAIDFGLIVDGAIIILESVLLALHNNKDYHKQGLNTFEFEGVIESYSNKMMNAAIFGQIIILIVYLPIFSLQGIEGKMFKPMAQTVAFALIGAFILSITYVPTITAMFIHKKTNNKIHIGDTMMRYLENKFIKLLSFCLRRVKYIITSIVIVFAISLYLLTKLGGEFIPTLEEGDFAVQTKILTGSNLNTAIEKNQKIAGILKSQFPEVEKVVVKIGSGEIPTDPMPIEAGDMMIILKPKSTWTSAKTFPELSNKMQEAINVVPGVLTSFLYPVQLRFNELISGAKQDVVCKLFGSNLDTLATYANKIADIINSIHGAIDVNEETITGVPQIVIDFNREMLAQYDVKIQDVNKIINAAFAGYSAGYVFENEKKFDIVIRLDKNSREKISDVQNLLIPIKDDKQIPLFQIANITLENSVYQIQRERVERNISIGFNTRNVDVETVVDNLKLKLNNLKLPVGYFIEIGGSFENLQEAKNRLSLIVPITLVLILLMLYFAFKSLREAIIIFSAIPFSIIGGILLLYIRGIPFSISAAIGFIALFGVAVLNGIVLITEYHRIKNDGIYNSLRIVLKGTRIRLRPVLITALVAAFGFLPMALSTEPGANVQRPLATVVIGGLISSTILTLIILPMLFILIDYKKKKKKETHKKSIFISAVFILFCIKADSQNYINLNQAVDSCLKNNINIQENQLKASYFLLLKNSKAVVPSTNFEIEYGNFNSDNNDSRISISQSFFLPQVQKMLKKMYNANYDLSNSETEIIKQTIQTDLKKQYYAYLVLLKKEYYLHTIDTVLKKYLKVLSDEVKYGETFLINKLNLENKNSQNLLKIKENDKNKMLVLSVFNLLMNTEKKYIPSSLPIKYNFNLNDKKLSEDVPMLTSIHKEKNLLITQQFTEKTNLLPIIEIGFNNQSFLYNHSSDHFNTKNRYSSVQAIISVPIFTNSIKTKVKSFEILKQQNQLKYESKLKEVNNNFTNWQIEYNHLKEEVEIYEQEILPNIEKMTNTIQKQLQAGEIDYHDFSEFYLQFENDIFTYLEKIEKLNNIAVNLESIIK